jgi:cell wall-associated NlpC family hydrolase
MRILPASPRRALQGLAAAWVLCLAATPAFAAPGEAADPLLDLLAAKQEAAAIVPVEATEGATPGLLRQVHDRAADLTLAAMEFVGVRYRRGGTSAETGFDCSGFTQHVFEMSLGLVLPRRAEQQAAAPGLVAVERADLRPGDLVFFNTLRRTFSHVGIYVGDNKFIHSPRPGKRVRTDDLSFAYWAKRFTGARRAETTAGVDPARLEPTAAVAAPVAAGS